MGNWIVTGASRGLGRHLALRLVQRGLRVLAVARDADRLAALAAAGGHDRIVPVPLDLADAGAIRPTLERAIEAEGGLEGVINNAGIGRNAPFEHHDEAECLRVLQVNLAAAVQVCHVALPWLKAAGGGSIVNIGSDLGRRPLANMAVYAASKHGLAGFSHSLLRELKGQGIRVLLIGPGIIDTDFGGGREGSRDPHASIAPATLAALIDALLQQPANLVIDELSVHPLGQEF